MMRQNKNLMDINIDALYNILKQKQGDFNDAMGSKKKTVVLTFDPLALIAEKTKVSKIKEKVVVYSNSEGSEADDFSELKKNTALLAKAFNRRKFYSKPTNNNLRTSSTSQVEIVCRDVNDAMGSKKKTVVVTSDPLALITEKTNISSSESELSVILHPSVNPFRGNKVMDALDITKHSLVTNQAVFEASKVTFKRMGLCLCVICFKTHTLHSKCRHGNGSDFVPPPDCGDSVVTFVLYDLTKPQVPFSFSVHFDHVDDLVRDMRDGFALPLHDSLLFKGLRTAKHPLKPAPSLPHIPIDHHQLIASLDVVLNMIKSFPRGTSYGRDGLLVNLFLDGKCPKMLGEYVASAPLKLLVKPGGGIHPIGRPSSMDFDFISGLVMKRVAKSINLMDVVAKINDPKCKLLLLRVFADEDLYLTICICGLGVYSVGDVLNYAFLASRLKSASLQTKLLQHSDIVTPGIAFDNALNAFNAKMEIDLLSNPTGKEVDIGLGRGRDKCLRPANMLLYSWDRGLDVWILAGKEIDIGLGEEHDKPLRLVDMLLYSWDKGLDVCVDPAGFSPLTQIGKVDFVPGRAMFDAAHPKHVKYEAKCSVIGYVFLAFLFSLLGELEKDAVASGLTEADLKGGSDLWLGTTMNACSKIFTRDIYGDHVISCAGTIVIKHRHNVVRDTLVKICFWLGISAGKEVDIGLGGGCDKPLRPADMLLNSWDELIDVCVVLTRSDLSVTDGDNAESSGILTIVESSGDWVTSRVPLPGVESIGFDINVLSRVSSKKMSMVKCIPHRLGLVVDRLAEATPSYSQMKKSKNFEKVNMFQCKRKVVDWHFTVAIKFLTSFGVYPSTPDTLNDLEAKHSFASPSALSSSLLGAEAVATACYTQDRSVIHTRYNKTPYELLRYRKPKLKYLYVFGALCYPTNDFKDLGKLQPKVDIEIFIGYSPSKKAYQIYSKRTRLIMETINIHVDELTQMASEQHGLGLDLQGLTSGYISSILMLNQATSISANTPTKNDWDVLFQPIFDEYFKPLSVVSTPIFVGTLLPPGTSGAPSSTYIDKDAPYLSISPNNETTSPPINSTNVEEPHNEEDAVFDSDTFINLFVPPDTSSTKSSSMIVDTSSMHTFQQPQINTKRWTWDHLLVTIIDNPSKPILTRHQLATDALWCYFHAFLVKEEPKNYKEAMIESSWIKAMQEKIHKF
nr:integrase, catalytic region, zinc finger, CCHC-type, peptidase aspartic, catalytic [Tanacetum cinerariifolium]